MKIIVRLFLIALTLLMAAIALPLFLIVVGFRFLESMAAHLVEWADG